MQVWDLNGSMWVQDTQVWTDDYFEAKGSVNCGSGINAGVVCGERYILTAKR